jgi:hypothetical protein
MLIDAAVRTHIYKRGGIFFLPLGFFQQAATQCGGDLLLKEDWSQVLFLCSDAVAISFWLQRPGEEPVHTLVSVEVDDLARAAPELIDLWLWKHLSETWDEVRAFFVGRNSVSEYARSIAQSYPQWVIPRNAGFN